ncbi:MAG TPA: MarR family transcriptional regulator [Pseudonocardia sp.]|nr:MarR family transcriptional regulator [Pseudonocardia sp.]
MSDPALHVLHAVRLSGLASEGAVATATGLPEADVAELMATLADSGLVKWRTGRMPGYSLTAEGRSHHADRVAGALPADARPGLERGYRDFLPLNAAFKQLCTDWQLRQGPGGEQVPNDHTDAAYDGAIVDRLGSMHAEITAVLAGVAAALPRFAGYPRRFASALARLRAGERSALARPMSDSYHDVWMQLHEDFLLSLGRGREEADGC